MTSDNASPSMKNPPEGYRWLDDNSWNRLKFRTRGHVVLILSETRKWYGQAELVDGQTEALMNLFEQTWDIVRGKDMPIKAPKHFNRYDEDKYGLD